MRIKMNRTLTGSLGVLMTAGAAQADNWTIHLTVDNQFDVYYGTQLTTNFYAGGGNNWATQYTFNATGRPTTDFLYVATASDFGGAQGFIGTFKNTTLNTQLDTNTTGWQVFPAGQYLQQIFGMGGSWPFLTMPTQAQVNAAINYATVNNLWVAPVTAPGYDNNPSTPIAPNTFIWGTPLPNVTPSAQWIWHDTGRHAGFPNFMPAPFAGFNHDEFLVFRVPGIAPEPTACLMLAAGGLVILRRRASAQRVNLDISQ